MGPQKNVLSLLPKILSLSLFDSFDINFTENRVFHKIIVFLDQLLTNCTEVLSQTQLIFHLSANRFK